MQVVLFGIHYTILNYNYVVEYQFFNVSVLLTFKYFLLFLIFEVSISFLGKKSYTKKSYKIYNMLNSY